MKPIPMEEVINMATYRVNHGQIIQTGGIDQSQKPRQTEKLVEGQKSFKEILDGSIKEKSEVKLSFHAQQRLDQRNIKLDEADMSAIKDAMEKAEKKGAKDALLLYKDLALVTSIKNKTIITAVDSKSADENVFTNIDSAVLVR